MRTLIHLLVIAALFAHPTQAQSDNWDPDLLAFLDQLQENFFMPLIEKDVPVTNHQRAMLFGYALSRQTGYVQAFDTDKARLNKLKENVRDFIASISDEAALWQTTLEAMEGKRDSQVLELMGESPRYVAVFTSIGDAMGDRTESNQNFSEFSESQNVMALVGAFCAGWKREDYDSIIPMLGGSMVDEFSNAINQMKADSGAKAQMTQMALNLEWQFVDGTVYAGEPEYVILTYSLKEPDDWHSYTIELLKDGHKWKIIKFDR